MSRNPALPPLRSVTVLYLGSLAAAAVSTAAALIAVATAPTSGRILLGVALTAGAILASLFPINFGHRTFITLDHVALVPAVLLFDPGIAVLIAGASVLITHFLRRRAYWLEPPLRRTTWAETIFNASSAMLQMAAAGMVLAGIGWDYRQPKFELPMPLVALAVAGSVMYAINRLAFSGVVSFQEGIPLATVFYDSTVGRQPAEHLQYLA